MFSHTVFYSFFFYQEEDEWNTAAIRFEELVYNYLIIQPAPSIKV